MNFGITPKKGTDIVGKFNDSFQARSSQKALM